MVYYHFESQINGTQILDNPGNSSDDGNLIKTYQWNADDRGRWSLESAGSGYYDIKSHTGKCLDIIKGTMANSTQVELYTCSGGDNQRWKFST